MIIRPSRDASTEATDKVTHNTDADPARAVVWVRHPDLG